MNISHDQILGVLRTILLPEKKMDILSLDMVQDLAIEGNKISLSLIFPKATHPLRNAIKNLVIKKIKDLDDTLEVNVDLKAKSQPQSVKADEIESGIKNIIAIASGKGGVGKSTVAANLAVALAERGNRVGLVDADIYGPSIPKMFGVEDEKPMVENIEGRDRIFPIEKYGVKLLSIGFFISPADATIWRGPMASNALKQLVLDGYWGDLDYLLIDLPPGTSDIHLTLVQTLAVTGAIVVSTPQSVALADAIKGISMFKTANINVPILGLVENMAWFTPAELPDNKYYIFGKEGCKKLAETLQIPFLGQIPIVQSICESGDDGTPVVLKNELVSLEFKKFADNVVRAVLLRNETISQTKKVQMTR